ncbi:MAG TPA: DUF4349 domain-containing protein [Candidatus Acidoferrum sp.]|nr:DUF4349 domain-containing protein [Candidatus Acidoferrum sp.]
MENTWQSVLLRFRELSPARRRLVSLIGVLGMLVALLLLRASRDTLNAPQRPPASGSTTFPTDSGFSSVGGAAEVNLEKEARAFVPLSTLRHGVWPNDLADPSREPRIAYSAQLSVITKEFARSHSSLEEILERHRGYIAKLRMVGQPSGSVLTATLRIPASEYGTALTELKSVGTLEHDEEAADEIAEQRGDLDARLQNAQNAERRLQLLLKERSSKGVTLASIEQQLSQLHNEIERMGAERRSYDSRLVFSNVFFSMKEERTLPAETLGEQIRSAAAAGFSDALHSLSTILLFFASYGPPLVLWVCILFIPGRYVWRRWRQSAVAI